MSPEPTVSVVICTHNGARSLPIALAAVSAQELRGAELELIVVDDRSTDASADIAARAGARVVSTNGGGADAGGIAAARNAGAAAASGAIVAFTDDDCEPARTWLSELIAPFADPNVDGVAGDTVPASRESPTFRYLALRNPLAPLPAALLESANPLFRLRRYLRDGLGPTPPLGDGSPLYSVVGANMAFRRGFLADMGGFDARIAFGGEEEDLCRRAHLRARGARFVYAPSARVRHHYRPGLRDSLRRARAYGQGNARQAIENAEIWPIVFPFPLLTGAAVIAAALGARRALPAALALPLVLYPGWLTHAVRRRDAESLLFAYVQLAQEVATMTGEVDHYLARAMAEA